eukprot:GHVS01097713.1.p2 GENE.GHVS01097713.1~~GHVS01097713.1.p2  ORF type:complete len:100 (+),score=13.53 GHVS01097713.1:447-746(+)
MKDIKWIRPKLMRRSRSEKPTCRGGGGGGVLSVDSAPSSWVQVRNLLSVVLRLPTSSILLVRQARPAATAFWWTNSRGAVQERPRLSISSRHHTNGGTV